MSECSVAKPVWSQTGRFFCLCGLIAFLNPLLLYGGVTDGLAPCVVFLVEEKAENAKCGSGFLVQTNETVFVVTAAHVANDVGTNVQIVMPGSEGKGVGGKISCISWNQSTNADVAVTRLKPRSPNELAMLIARSLPTKLLCARPLPPDRDIPLTVMGYPKGLGAGLLREGYVSPLSKETKAASGLITLPRADNGMLATFIVLQDPSIEGLSGGPVFDTGSSYFSGGRAMTIREGVSLVGLVHGTIADNTGGKLAAIVPATEIIRVLIPLF